MSNHKSFLRLFTERGPLAVLAVAGVLLFGIVGPASAQFFNFGGFDRRPAPPRGPPQGGFYNPYGDPAAQEAPRPVDMSRAPPAAKREVPPEKNIVVLGDSMADWLAYGLEDALLDTPELGVIRKHKTVSGLIKYQPRGEPSDWVAAAKQILANEKPDAIVVMLGINDRAPIREAEIEKPKKEEIKKGAKKDVTKDAKKTDKKNDATKPEPEKKDAADTAKPDDDKAADAKPDAAADDDDAPATTVAPERTVRSANGWNQFRSERWVELYSKKIAEMIGVLKQKGVPVLWVGLPAVRGATAMTDMLFLDSLYRDVAGKAGITYVDVWDGFVDEQGRFMQQGPDFEGQTRRLRSYDGVYFTKSGAVKLARFAEREITRLLAARTLISLPSELQSPDANIRPSVAGPRPLVGPMVPLVASNVGTDELLGGTGTRPVSVDALAARTLVKGEPLAAPAGRADDFSWPRRQVGALEAPPGDPNVATVAPNGAIVKPQPLKPVVRAAAQGVFDPNRPPPRPFDPNNGFQRPPATVGPSNSGPGFRW